MTASLSAALAERILVSVGRDTTLGWFDRGRTKKGSVSKKNKVDGIRDRRSIPVIGMETYRKR